MGFSIWIGVAPTGAISFSKKNLDLLHATWYYCYMQQEGVNIIAEKSRADYFKERRERFKAFHVEVEREKMERFEEEIAKENKSKKEWLDEKIDEELKK